MKRKCSVALCWGLCLFFLFFSVCQHQVIHDVRFCIFCRTNLLDLYSLIHLTIIILDGKCAKHNKISYLACLVGWFVAFFRFFKSKTITYFFLLFCCCRWCCWFAFLCSSKKCNKKNGFCEHVSITRSNFLQVCSLFSIWLFSFIFFPLHLSLIQTFIHTWNHRNLSIFFSVFFFLLPQFQIHTK